MRHLYRTAIFILFLAAISSAAQAQDARTRQRDELASAPKSIPSQLIQQVQALGVRMRTPGKEETALEATFIDAGGQQKTLRVTHQISGAVRIENTKDKTTVSFDGDLPWGVRDRSDELLLDTFVMDTPEAMLYSSRSGASMVLLGRGFGPDPRTNPDYKGLRYDIYEVISPGRSGNDKTLQMRRYYFDSQTALLESTRYTDAKGVNVETRFRDWGRVDGSVYPGRIERYENGQLSFSLVIATASSQSRQDAANFR